MIEDFKTLFNKFLENNNKDLWLEGEIDDLETDILANYITETTTLNGKPVKLTFLPPTYELWETIVDFGDGIELEELLTGLEK